MNKQNPMPYTLGKAQKHTLWGALAVAVIAMAATGCSDTDVINDTPDPVNPDVQVVGSPMRVLTGSTLDKYVTNYKKAVSRSGESDVTLTMPVSCPDIPEAALELASVNFYWFPDEAAREAAKTLKVTQPTEAALPVLGDMTIYVSDTYTIVGANSAGGGYGDVKIYVLPGGSVVLKGNWSNGLPFHVDNSSLTIYNYGSIDAANESMPCNIENVTIHSATAFDIANVGIGTDAELYAYDGIVADDLNVYVGSTVYAGCKIVCNNSLTIDSGASVSTGYVSSPLITLKGNGDAETQLLELRNGGLWESDHIVMNNVDHILVGSDTADSYSCISAQEITVNDIDLTGTFQNTYINCTNWTGDNRAADTANLQFAPTVSLNDDASIEVAAGDSCAPKYVRPVKPAPDPEDPFEEITDIETPALDHNHPISATCIDIDGDNAFVSWHERGGNIHGCIEWLQIDRANQTTTFKAWMETDTWSWGSSTEGAGASTAYDFNHVIYDNGYLITVGDHAKKGGFVGLINLADIVGVGDGYAGEAPNLLLARQLVLPNSGNAVVRHGNQLYIACAGGYQVFDYAPATFGTQKWGDNFLATTGSAKHLASNGTYVVTIEYTEPQSTEVDPFWDDTETAVPAKITVWDANGWLTSKVAEWTVPAFAPMYGKDAIAIDSNNVIYSCQGRNGVVAYDLNGQVLATFNATDYIDANRQAFEDKGYDPNRIRNSAANGLCFYGDYVFVANGGAGVYVLNRADLSVAAYYIDSARYHNNTGASANYVKVNGDGYVYVAYGLGGVKVLKFDATGLN